MGAADCCLGGRLGPYAGGGTGGMVTRQSGALGMSLSCPILIVHIDSVLDQKNPVTAPCVARDVSRMPLVLHELGIIKPSVIVLIPHQTALAFRKSQLFG